jgi:molybdenum cofactor biosynthesis protein B
MSQAATAQGHSVVFHQVIPDEKRAIGAAVESVIAHHSPHVLLVSGGTGIAGRDVTVESIQPRFEKTLAAFGTLFALLSYQEISSAAIMSRAIGGVISKTVVFCLPGSLNACQLACKQLIFPELGHLTKHLHDG